MPKKLRSWKTDKGALCYQKNPLHRSSDTLHAAAQTTSAGATDSRLALPVMTNDQNMHEDKGEAHPVL